MNFSEDEIQRYARHILLPEVGGTGQDALKNASILVIGAGGLGSPVALYLAAAGVGRIGLVDDDVVELSNLQRQIAHVTDRIGQPKVESAAIALRALNPGTQVDCHNVRLTVENARALVRDYDLVCDGCDNFATRYLVADACALEARTLVSAAVLRFEGQLSTFRPGGPCYRCLYPEAPPAGTVPSCAEAGVFGAVTGVMGTLQATEALKEILGIGESLAGRLLVWDALAMRFHTIALPSDPDCALCGTHPIIHDLSAHHGPAPAGCRMPEGTAS
ncbi:molybdopterin-synthase adenylyltransferase MoeB [Komagataeibacter sp. FNDCF1]|uniref:HesA/MoeB/ThiF family protein n=1 Tax=Komagataeibacter sp. FNDCF1 TaxID=2878681 RepID=UPI001E2C6CCB|nr:molybdopterin-synthase adenylyltransferase MoeB [Komagataeibacter sp. FNDCF1]